MGIPLGPDQLSDGKIHDISSLYSLVQSYNETGSRSHKSASDSDLYEYTDWLAREWVDCGRNDNMLMPIAHVLEKLTTAEYRDPDTLMRALTPLAEAHFKKPPPLPENPWLHKPAAPTWGPKVLIRHDLFRVD